MLQAMIAATNADGHIDEDERQVIYQQVDTYDLSISDKASLFEELRRPLSLEELVNKVPNPQTAVGVYAVSLLAIDEAQTKGGLIYVNLPLCWLFHQNWSALCIRSRPEISKHYMLPLSQLSFCPNVRVVHYWHIGKSLWCFHTSCL